MAANDVAEAGVSDVGPGGWCQKSREKVRAMARVAVIADSQLLAAKVTVGHESSPCTSSVELDGPLFVPR